MRILLDGIHIGPNMKGVGRYVINVLRHLSAMDSSLQISVLVLQRIPSHILLQKENIEYIHIPWRNHIYHGLRILPQSIKSIKPDAILIPYEGIVWENKYPYLMICHDVPHQIRNAQNKSRAKSFSLKEYSIDRIDGILLPWTLRNAKRVFSNSRYVAEWLQTEINILPANIRLAPCAPGADFFHLQQTVDTQRVLKRLGTPRGYILVIYTGDERENFGVVPETYNYIKSWGLPQALVVAGVKHNVRHYVESCISRFPWRDQVHIVPFLGSDQVQELAELYTAASLYLDPSLHEGFGMQVVEAMACGTPVVCSDRGALSEVTGNAAILINPENPYEIANAIKRLLENNQLIEHYRKLGYQRSSIFSWKRTAKVVYEGLIEVVCKTIG